MNQNTFYKTYNNLLLDIKSLKRFISSLKYELDIYIQKSAPMNVRAISYDQVPSAKIYIPERQIINKIADLKITINIQEMVLFEKEEALEDLKRSIRKLVSKSNDLEKKIFVLAWLDGKQNLEIASELGYSLQHVKNIKTEVYRKIDSEAI